MIRRSILLLLSIIVALIPSLHGTTTLSIENVSACLKSKIAGKKYRKAKEKAFFLNYGEYGAEAFNVFSNSDIKEIELLSECVVEENLTYFFPSEHQISARYGGSNVTVLTEVFQSVLPNVYAEIVKSFMALLRRVEWKEERKSFGVRSVKFLSFEKEGLEEYRRDLQKKYLINKRRNSAFVIGSEDSSEDIEIPEPPDIERMEHDESLRNYLYHPKGTLYTLICLFNDRSKFIGGEVVIDTESGTSLQIDQPEYDDEEEEDEDNLFLPKNRKAKKLRPVVEKMSMERSSLLVIHGNFHHGIEEVKVGKRRGLVIELWKYNDAPASPVDYSIQQGEALGIISAEQEL